MRHCQVWRSGRTGRHRCPNPARFRIVRDETVGPHTQPWRCFHHAVDAFRIGHGLEADDPKDVTELRWFLIFNEINTMSVVDRQFA